MKEAKTITVMAKKPNGETATLEIFYEPTTKRCVVKNAHLHIQSPNME